MTKGENTGSAAADSFAFHKDVSPNELKCMCTLVHTVQTLYVGMGYILVNVYTYIAMQSNFVTITVQNS